MRILSIEKDTGKNQILFLGINKDGKFLCGTIDKELVTDAMTSNTMIECLTNDIQMDTDIGSYIGLSKDDSFVEVVSNDLSFPTVSDLTSKIGSILTSEEDKPDHYILEGVIIQKPEEIQLVSANNSNHKIPATRVSLRDDTGTIDLTSNFDAVLNKLSVGDKIRVVGALPVELDNVRTLRKGAYGAIIKIGTEDVGESDVVATDNDGGFDVGLNVDKTIEKNNIRVTLHRIDFTENFTRGFLTIENMSEDEVLFYLYENIAVQNKRQFPAHYGESIKGINRAIPPGIKESGAITFDPLTQNNMSFRFRIQKPRAQKEDFLFTIDFGNEFSHQDPGPP